MPKYLFADYLTWDARAAACDVGYPTVDRRDASGRCPIQVALDHDGLPYLTDEDGQLTASAAAIALVGRDSPDVRRVHASANRFIKHWDGCTLDERSLPRCFGVWRIDVEGRMSLQTAPPDQ